MRERLYATPTESEKTEIGLVELRQMIQNHLEQGGTPFGLKKTNAYYVSPYQPEHRYESMLGMLYERAHKHSAAATINSNY